MTSLVSVHQFVVTIQVLCMLDQSVHGNSLQKRACSYHSDCTPKLHGSTLVSMLSS